MNKLRRGYVVRKLIEGIRQKYRRCPISEGYRGGASFIIKYLINSRYIDPNTRVLI